MQYSKEWQEEEQKVMQEKQEVLLGQGQAFWQRKAQGLLYKVKEEAQLQKEVNKEKVNTSKF